MTYPEPEQSIFEKYLKRYPVWAERDDRILKTIIHEAFEAGKAKTLSEESVLTERPKSEIEIQKKYLWLPPRDNRALHNEQIISAIHEAFTSSPTARELAEQKERYGKEQYDKGFRDGKASQITIGEVIARTKYITEQVKAQTAREIFDELDKKRLPEGRDIQHWYSYDIKNEDYEALRAKYLGEGNNLSSKETLTKEPKV